uniref:Uncharacterized 4.6 kDa protein n=1 Tax=Leptolyngbya boryana TaxID=1184 RepID=YPS1_LEPBY|nr:RecName: Full=Uncharacterized 4.6 kDa protein; AltName: Full=ORF1 [Leptolyngbya boryana]
MLRWVREITGWMVWIPDKARYAGIRETSGCGLGGSPLWEI